MPKLLFEMDLSERAQMRLIWGKLTYSDDFGKNITFEATTGAPGYQYMGAWKVPRRGCLPPSTAIGQEYSVSTQALYMPNTAGVGGDFYAISPFSVDVGGVKRGDFGIHLDANYLTSPGSAGCIVLRQAHWALIRKAFAKLNELRVKAIPLQVRYT